MAIFAGIGIRTVLRCQSATPLRAHFTRADLAEAVATFSLEGEERLLFAVYRDDPRAAEIVRGRVATVMTDVAATFDEWRIADLEDMGTGDDAKLIVTCLPISADLSRAFYVSWDGDGVPLFSYTMAIATPTNVLDGPVRDALDEASLTYIDTGTVNPTNTFDIDGEHESAMQIVKRLTGVEYGNCEFRLRRDGTSGYLMDLLSQVGSSANTLYLRTAKNLTSLRRRRPFADSATRVFPLGNKDGTNEGIGYAYWLITVKNTAGDDYLEVTDPRGTSFPGPAAAADQFNGKYAAELGVAFMSAAITDTVVVSVSTTRLYIADVSAYTVGRYIEFRDASGATARRTTFLDHPSAQTTYGGVFSRTLPNERLSGAVNYVPNPAAATWSNAANPPDDWTVVLTPTYVKETTITRFGGASFHITADAAGEGTRSPTVRVYDDSPYTWILWAWVYVAVGTAVVTYRRADTFADLSGGGETITVTGVWKLVIFETAGGWAAGGGFVIQVASANAADEFYVDAFGCQPGTWTRRDEYTPRACDLWHAGNQYLADAIEPVEYEGDIIDLEQLDGTAFSAEALAIGQTVSIKDEILNVTTSQRLIEFSRDYLTTNVAVRFATKRLTFAEYLSKRVRKFGKVPQKERRIIFGDIGGKLAKVAQAIAAGTSLIPETGASPATLAETVEVIAEAMLEEARE